MHIRFQRDELLKPLSFVAGVVERRQTLPILSYVLLKPQGETVALTGTDLEVEVVVEVPALESKGEELTVPARKLLDICRALPGEAEMEIRKEGEKVVVKAGRSRFSLVTLPVTDFPNIQTAEWQTSFRLTQGRLKSLLEQTHFCMAQQDVRYYLNGLLFELGDGSLKAVATDGHRMGISEADVESSEQLERGRQAIIPRKGVAELMRMLEAVDELVEIQLSGNHLRAKTRGLVFTTKLIDGRYPDYTKVVPVSQTKSATIVREAFREALGRVAILSNEKYRGVRLTLEGQSMKLTAHNPDQEEAQEEVTVEHEGEGIEIGFNVTYLMDATSAMKGEKVVMELSDANSSCTLHAPASKHPTYVIMPMRL